MCYLEMESQQKQLDVLQREVEKGLWRTNPDLLEDIYNRYLALAEKGVSGADKFGTPDFWDHVLNG